MPRVIINADDFGLSPAVNRGIVHAHRHGVVTSTSLMVLRPSAVEAAHLAADCSELSLGLHLDLVEHQVVDGHWRRTVARVDLDDRRAVEDEVRSQLRRFVELIGADPTHLDTHQHHHLNSAAAPIITEIADEMGLPLRGVTLPYRGSFYGQYGVGVPYPDGITKAALLATIVSGTDPFVEVACHPAEAVDMDDTYAVERLTELRVLCDPTVALAIEMSGVELVNRSGRTRSRASWDLAGR